MFDTLEKIEDAMVQHGDIHKRVYLMQARQNNWNSLIPKMKSLAKEKSYNKILSRVPEEAIDVFCSNGYKVEAKIPGLYNGRTTGYFLAVYLDEERSHCDDKELKTIESVKTIAKAANSSMEDAYFELPSNLRVFKLERKEVGPMSNLHKKAFKYHPSPLINEDYLFQLFEDDYEFYGLIDENELLVTAILKKYEKEAAVELIDFVTHPNYRGQNLSYYLVQEIKAAMEEQEFKTIYSLVRSTSYGLNITFSKHGFSFGGTLLNNTYVRDCMESMNVWYLNWELEHNSFD